MRIPSVSGNTINGSVITKTIRNPQFAIRNDD